MRVLHIITRLIVGGAQENTVASVLGLHAKPDLDVRLLSGPTTGPEGSLVPLLTPVSGLLEVVPSLVRPIAPWRDVQGWRALTRYCRAWKPHLVHTHSGKAGILGRWAARSAGVPIVVHTIHGPSFGRFQGPVPNALYRQAERLAGRCTTHFVSVAQAMTNQYLAAGIGRPQDYSLVHSGFDLNPFLHADRSPAPRAAFGFQHEDVVVGMIGRLTPLKGHEDLIQAAGGLVGRCPRLRFLLVGDGPLRAQLEGEVAAAGLTNYFRFAGLIKPADMPPLIGMMDLLVHLSLREGLPRALPQSLAAGRPVVAYDCDGAAEVCLPGRTGYLIAPRDLSALQEAVVELATSPGLRAELGAAGRALVREQFGVEKMIDALHALYRRLGREAGVPGLSGQPTAPQS